MDTDFLKMLEHWQKRRKAAHTKWNKLYLEREKAIDEFNAADKGRVLAISEAADDLEAVEESLSEAMYNAIQALLNEKK